jgi:hypothetical protein
MNCSSCRYELSQCLDGRLPAGRRAIVMQHAGDCTGCGTFWAELQAAQQLTLQLRRPRVGSDFRESLWQRIQAGEGTPEAVFHEPVPLVAKLRYALTGAAAAAAALLCAMWLAPDDAVHVQPVASAEPAPSKVTPNGGGLASTGGVVPRVWHQEPPVVDDAPLMQRLGVNLVALETAKQLEQRYTGTTAGLHRLDRVPGEASHDVVRDVLTNAQEFRDFGQLLLDLCDRQRLVFTDDKIESDLRFAVNMLAQTRGSAGDVRTVRTFVAPALESQRLASVSRKIFLGPLDPREEQELVARIGITHPDTFAKLFVLAGDAGAFPPPFAVFRVDGPLPFDDRCETFVAPASQVQELAARGVVRITRTGQRVEVRMGK